MAWVASYIVTHVPLWVWVAIAGGILLALYGVWHLGAKQMLIIGGLLAIGLIWPAAARSGWKAKEKQDMDRANKAIDDATDARRKQEELNRDPKHLRDDDGFKRPG